MVFYKGFLKEIGGRNMDIIYFFIILFFITLFFVIGYLTTTIWKNNIKSKKIQKLKEEMTPVFHRHLQYDTFADVPKQEMNYLRKQLKTKEGLHAFHELFTDTLRVEEEEERIFQYTDGIVEPVIDRKSVV